MPKVSLNELIKSVCGKVGGLISRGMPDGTLVVRCAPEYRQRQAALKQEAHRARLKAAAEYGSWA